MNAEKNDAAASLYKDYSSIRGCKHFTSPPGDHLIFTQVNFTPITSKDTVTFHHFRDIYNNCPLRYFDHV